MAIFKASNGLVVSFKSTYDYASDYMIYDRASNTEQRFRIDSVSGQPIICCDRIANDAQLAAIYEYRAAVEFA